MKNEPQITIRVRLFAGARESAGCESLSVRLAAGARVAELRAAIAEQCPPLSSIVSRSLFALDAEYAAEDRVVSPDADVACIPPVSGG